MSFASQVQGGRSSRRNSFAESNDDGNRSRSPSASSRLTKLTEAEVRLRSQLRFHFLDPLRKWYARRKWPWKLSLQILKVLLITSQLVVFAQMRVSHVSFLQKSNTVFRHLFLKNWLPTRDIQTYPPATGRFAVYTYEDMFKALLFASRAYYRLNTTAIGQFDYDTDNNTIGAIPLPKLCVKHLRDEELKKRTFPSAGDTPARVQTSICTRIENITALHIGEGNWTAYQHYLDSLKFPLNFTTISSATLSMRIRAAHLRNLEPYGIPDCFAFDLSIIFDNTQHTGLLEIDLTTDIVYVERCNGKDFVVLVASEAEDVNRSLLDVLDAVVIIVCAASFILCVRALVRAEKLRHETVKMFSRRGFRMSQEDGLTFVNLWYVFICVNDVCTIVGTMLKLFIQFRQFDSDIFTAAGIMLGCGNILVWCGLMRYLHFFSQYNILLLTLRKALPSVVRFIVCSSFIYMGFVFCGWTVLGPYHYKFRTIMASSECLFSLINGDDMFATFDTMSHTNPSVWWFSRVYLYGFICLFIYSVLSLFIAIIMDAYEMVKDRYEHRERPSLLHLFIEGNLNLPPVMEVNGAAAHTAHDDGISPIPPHVLNEVEQSTPPRLAGATGPEVNDSFARRVQSAFDSVQRKLRRTDIDEPPYEAI